MLKSGVLVFFVNGKKVIDPNPDPECTLLAYLRDKLRLCGTKLGCGEGGCGACTVMLSKIDRTTREIKHMAVNACLTPICSVHGVAVTTVEGIGSTKTRLHTVQERIAKAHGSQCGFCTPGIVMSMYALLRNLPKPSMKDMEIAFQGNLCRCTGYRPIIEGYKTLTKEFDCAMGENCCRNGTRACKQEETDEIFEKNAFVPYDPSQEPIFPPELKLHDVLDKDSITFNGPRAIWMRPTTLRELLLAKEQYPDAKIVVGNTEVGVEVKFKHMFYPVTISPALVVEMNSIEVMGDGLQVGASVTLDNMEIALREQIKDLPEHETRIFKAIVDMLHFFAGKQVRNMAAVGGNIMTGSPISDLNPIFTAAAIELEVQSASRGRRIIHMGKGFFTGYRRNIIEQDEVLTSIILPKTNINQYFYAYKQAKRRDDDIAIVNIAVNVLFHEGTDFIDNLSISYGGMAPITLLASESCAVVKGMKWNGQFIEAINSKLINELPLDPSAPGGMIQYRRSLTLSLFFKAYLNISQQLQKKLPNHPQIDDVEKSGSNQFHTLPLKSAQLFEQFTEKPVGRPQVHASAFKQACGEAVYCDDMPKWENELYLTPILSTKSHAKIISIDATEALQLPGVHAFFSAKDLTEHQNSVGPVFHDDSVFAKDEVCSQGQVVGAIVADNQTLSQRASRLVKIEYEDIRPVIVSITDAIKHKSFYPGYPKTIKSGDVTEAFKNVAHIVEGTCRMGGQEHFYLETHAAIALPRDNDELEVFASTQHPTEMQKLIAHTLSIPASKIAVRVKRLGGGFGGKESRGLMVAIPVALAAHKLGRPVRCMLDRDEDMLMTGTRHPFYFKYKAGCDADGKLIACEIEAYNNAGHSMDLSFSVLERAMFHFENSYFIPNVTVNGWVCRTNLPSNTAFRGFGGPQGMFAAEHIIRDVARVTGKPCHDVAALNLYKEGQKTHFNQKLENCQLDRCWHECMQNSKYLERLERVKKFNSVNRWRKRGMAIVPTTFGIAFTALHLNQAGALIHVYSDGSILLSHGGIEMGQGLHTKMIQVAATTLNVPCEKIHISESATDKVPNTSATAASAGSDLNGMAVLNACNVINERLAPYRKKYPADSWDQLANRVYFDRVSLSATGFYATPDIGYSFETNSGNPFNYFTYGVGCSEVEIDCLTGDHQVIRTDIVMDLGSSINPAIDIGQIEGAFMQGYGLFTLEEMIYSSNGTLFSRGPGAYKLPGFADIPGELNVSLLTGASNPRAVFSSKAVGEPPLFLASSVFFAIKEAISDARQEEKLSAHFDLISPATSARIRMACQDKFTKNFIDPPSGSFTPWNIMP